VDGDLVAEGLKMAAGAINSLDLTAFGGAGSVEFDNLIFLGMTN